ncbi:MAG: DUF3035 domain-containing protein [Oceanicaulis sp.]
MRIRTLVLISAAALFGATACTSGVRQALGTERTTPDEFRVVTIAPLTVPPEYNLRPPAPGELRAEDVFQDRQARRALFGDLDSSRASDAEILFAARAGAADANPDVRALIDGETAAIVRKRETLADRVMFWRDGEVRVDDEGNPIDPEAERARIERLAGDGDVEIRRRRDIRPKLPGL